jgi:hypothetical protein
MVWSAVNPRDGRPATIAARALPSPMKIGHPTLERIALAGVFGELRRPQAAGEARKPQPASMAGSLDSGRGRRGVAHLGGRPCARGGG